MTPAAAPPALCTTCRAPLAPGSDRCDRCGTLHGDHRKCPSCGAKAEVINREGGILFTCAACGVPRVPMEHGGVPRSGREREPLGRANVAYKGSIVAKLGGTFGVVTGSLIALVGVAMLALHATSFALVLLLMAAVAIAFSVWGLGVAKVRKSRAQDAMRDAMGAVALDVMRARGAISATILADQLGVSQAVAETVLERLPARDDVRVESIVDERAADGMVRYRIADAPDATSAAFGDAATQELDAEQAAFDVKLAAAQRAKERG